MPTTENDMPSWSIPLALQSLFYKLQYSDNSVATKELTKSFGWDTDDSFMQHDVQELNRVLCEKLEDKMKGTVVEGTIQHLFEGHYMNCIECLNVDYKSARKESFYDLQLDVKGCRDVYASFDKYVEVERLLGDNKYQAENLGLQDAKKSVLFIDFPPVLQLQLKRFEYDFKRDTSVKINDRYEFPLQLDLDKYLSPGADRTVRNLYTLHSVLVHSGVVHGGNYYVIIRPTLSHLWFKFDNEKVTKEDAKKALEEQYGGEELPQTNPGLKNKPFKFTKYSNAYMLVYIRESDKEKIMCDVNEKDIAEHLRIRLKKEQEEKEHRKKEKAESHLYTTIKVARNEDLKEQIGREIFFDLVDHDKVRTFRIQKQMSFNHFKEVMFKEFGIPVQFQRFWLWAKRQNHTYRPDRPLTPQEETQSVGQLKDVSNMTRNAELKLFLEVEIRPDLHFLPPPPKTEEEILLFFKLYDPEKEDLKFVGRLFVNSLGKPTEILSKLTEMAEFPPNEEIDLYEEIKFEPNVMCEPIDKRISFKLSQLQDGDIICYQKSLTSANRSQFLYPDVPSFLEYVCNHQVVFFRVLEKPKEEDFSLELSKLFTYDDVVERVARQLGVDDPSKIRLTSHNWYSQQPKPQPIKYRGVDHLSDMLVHYNQTSDILYYEILDIPLPELQRLKTLKVAFHHATKEEVAIHNIRLPKNSTVADVISDLKSKVELSRPDAEVRLLEVFYHKIYKIFPSGEKIDNINDQYWTLRAEEIPEEEKRLGLHDRLIHVYHFTRDFNLNQMQVKNFGEPFFLVIKEVETLADIKIRIQKKLHVPDDEFSKWKFAFISLGRPEYLQDSDIVFYRFQRRDIHGAWKQYFGLEHSDTAPKKAYSSNQERKLEPNVMCEHIDKQISIKSSQLEDGDIICYQKSLTSAQYSNDASFLEYVRNPQNVDTNVVAVTKRHHSDVGPSSAPVTPSLRNLQPGSSSRNGNLRNLKPEEHDRNRLYEENKPSVVFVSNLGARHDVFTLQVLEVPKGFGSGFIWDRIGHIVTNYHVIHGAFNLSVTLADKTEYKAKVVGYDQDNDVAVLRIDAPKEKLRPIKVGTSSNLCVCLDVCAIGHPFGLRYAWTPGVISELGVYFPSPANERPILDGILTNALINPGNSGGPLLDSSGYLIGIVTAIYSQIRESCGVAFAVPVDTVKGIVEQFVNFGEVREAYIR